MMMLPFPHLRSALAFIFIVAAGIALFAFGVLVVVTGGIVPFTFVFV